MADENQNETRRRIQGANWQVSNGCDNVKTSLVLNILGSSAIATGGK